MNDMEIYSKDAREMVENAHQTIYEQLGKLKYVNMKYKLKAESESRWLYNIDFMIKGDDCEIIFQNAADAPISLPLDALEFFKLRPYYIATCVGFKNIVFYAYPEGRKI